MMNKKVLIIGAGIGGLTAAISLKHIGYEPIVFERISQNANIGTTLALWPNAFKVFQSLGIAEDVMALGVCNERTIVHNAKGKRLYELPLNHFENKYGFPVMTVLRADLYQLLLEHLGAGHVRWESEFVQAEQNEQGVIAHFSNGDEERGDLLIGADGIHSKVRAVILGEVKLRYCGFAAYRGMVANNPANLPPHVGMEMWGNGKRFGHFHTGRKGIYWFATMNCSADRPESPANRRNDLLAGFADWHSSVAEIICQTEESSMVRHLIYDIPPMSSWADGRIVLLGDAAHAMTPNLGQGACQAIEDSGVLSECMLGENSIPSALLRYEALRIPRLRSVVKLSYRLGRITQWSNPLLCQLRNQAFSVIPSMIKQRQLDRIIALD
jgi:FAD-dependent urate hydroxylase